MDQNNQSNNSGVKEDVQGGGLGRINKESIPDKFTEEVKNKTLGGERDISEIDKQEGNMNNGALGGNFGMEENANRK